MFISAFITGVTANKITGANARGPRRLPMRTRWAARVAQFVRPHAHATANTHRFCIADVSSRVQWPHRQASFALPAIVIDQLPDYPCRIVVQISGGLVAALWRDGRMIRSTSPRAVGKSYVEGTVASQQCDEFFSFLSAATLRAPKIDGIPLHVATQSITIRSGDTSEWARILPDSESVWRDVESRLFDLPLQDSRAVDSSVAENLR